MAKKIWTVGSKSKLVKFYHEDMDIELHIYTGINDIEWGYKLNTVTFPTYGGEVVQVLSASVEVMNVGGDLTSYEDLMKVYTFFFKYFQIASQGRGSAAVTGKTSYNQKHMHMEYPERNWEFHIQPMSAPGFQIGRDFTLPTWRISTHVDHFQGGDLTDKIKQEAAAKATLDRFADDNDKFNPGNKDLSFYKLTEGVGYTEGSPFSDPFSSVSGLTEAEILAGKKAQIGANTEYYKLLGPAYSQGDFQALLYGFDSGPAGGDNEQQTAAGQLEAEVTGKTKSE